jgi:protoheme IX farnesyltransferase
MNISGQLPTRFISNNTAKTPRRCEKIGDCPKRPVSESQLPTLLPGAGGLFPIFSARLHMFAELTKLRIALLSTLSAATGYLVFCRTLNPGIGTVSLGVLLLAMSACAMNQIQDREIDARMERTCHRPIVTGAIRPATALVFAVFLAAAGSMLLWLLHNPAAALLGLLAVAWYNGVYTYLKRISAVAVLPGALVGALPPVIGWTAAGGNPLDPRVLALAFFFFIWQVPHFWLLLSAHSGDFDRAGLPSLMKVFSMHQFAHLSFVWMLTAAMSGLLLPMYLLTLSPWIILGMVVTGFWFAWQAWKLLRGRHGSPLLRPAFRAINLYAFCVMALLVVDALL